MFPVEKQYSTKRSIEINDPGTFTQIQDFPGRQGRDTWRVCMTCLFALLFLFVWLRSLCVSSSFLFSQ
jgi:hypothetical protein